ncbi:hypothetical protein RND81_11G184400 [Saponaria officinalis]|uniref:Uncharacterized protein n=1 Tax=Saponaria officinalis TaxID=3572 RepID=A0AAW1HP37_SAPOF
MKVKTPSLLKKIIAAFSNKTNELRIRFMIFFLLHKNIDKASLSHSLHALVSQPSSHHRKAADDGGLLEENNEHGFLMHYNHDEVEEEDLARVILKESEVELEEEAEGEVAVMGGGGGGGEMVEEEDGEVGEEDIDQAADMFIQRFKRQIQLQKQFSLERNQGLLLQSND